MSSVFAQLHPNIQRVLSSMHLDKPTEPQVVAIPVILQGKHVLLVAPTGMGKTESALLPIFHTFLTRKETDAGDKKDEVKGISILYVTPLRALNRDMLQRTFEWGKKLGINIAVRHGDTSQSERTRQSRNPPDMLITTPETVQILFTGKRLRKHLKTVRWVVVDEIHELAGDERGAQFAVALERLLELTRSRNNDFQRIGLSATVGSPGEVARYLGGVEQNSFREVTVVQIDVTKCINLSVELPTVKKNDYPYARHFSVEPISFASLRRCRELIDDHTSTLFFVNTRDSAEILASRFHLWEKDFPVDVHHGSLSKQTRVESEDEFKGGIIKSLICTSSLELGIDVGHTDFVIQYNSPREVARIIQRVGRSGHKVGKISEGIVIVTNSEDLAESLVIARRALHGELESLRVRKKPLSVLANQVISIALEYYSVEATKTFEIIRRSYPFHQLQFDEFTRILQQLKNQRSVWLEEKDTKMLIKKRQRSRQYFLENISMIPDEEMCSVVDISTRKRIGVLDESFVLNSGFEGAKFILRGRPWSVVKRDDAGLLVNPVNELGAIPSWVGEDIPVPFEVAREVGLLRRLASEGIDVKRYPCNKKTLQVFLQQIRNQQRQGFVIPDDKTITIESEGNNVVINACFGTKVNETIGRLVSALLAQSVGESIGVNIDSYRIHLEIPHRMLVSRLKGLLMSVKPESLEYLLRRILRNSTFVRWHLVHAARKFGALSKAFDYKTVGVHRLLTLFDNTLVFDEALDKLMWDRMDIENTQKVLQEIQRGEIDIHMQRLSPIALAGYETVSGLMLPLRPDRAILMSLQRRLENAEVIMVCVNCNHTWNTTVGRSVFQPRCPQCDAIRIAVVRRYNQDLIKLFKKKDRTKSEDKELKKLLKNASLVLSHGKYALLALAGRGIGPDTAARILSRYNRYDLQKSEETLMQFLKNILHAELTYARTRGFWGDN